MDVFEELSGSEGVNEVPPSSDPWSKGVNEVPPSSDPASEFLEREKEDLGDVLGKPPAPTAEPVVDVLSAPMQGLALSRSSSGKASPITVFSSMPRIEPFR